MIIGLNLMWSGLRSGARVHGGPVRRSQSDALAHLRRAAEYVIDGKEAPPLKGVPRTPKADWETLIGDARISYHGEVIQKAEALEFERVLPSLPPEGFGGIADLASLCEGQVREMVRFASSMRVICLMSFRPQKSESRMETGSLWQRLCLNVGSLPQLIGSLV